MVDYSSYSLDELIEVITSWPVGMPVRAMEQVLLRGENAIPALAVALERWRTDESRDLLWIIVLLGETRNRSAVPVLVDQVQRTDEEELARAACEGLAKIGPGSVPSLLQVADSPDPLAWIYTYAALGWIADEQAFSTLIDALHRDLELSTAVAQALCDHGRREAIAHLWDAYQICAPWQRIEFEEAIRGIDKLEKRRKLSGYRLAEGERRFHFRLSSARLGLTGKLDLLIDSPEGLFPVDFKWTTGRPHRNHVFQLCAYALLLEDYFQRPVSKGFVYLIPQSDAVVFDLTPELKQQTGTMFEEIRRMIENEVMPRPTPVRNRCTDCEYRNFCADIF